MNWSLRDLRTVAINERLNDELDGTYHPESRLWTFRTRELADKAEELARTQTLYLLRLPGGARLYDTLTSDKWGGVAISTVNEQGEKKRGVATFVFRNEEQFIDARRHAASVLRSTQTLATIEGAVGIQATMVYGVPREDLEQRFATGGVSEYQAATLAARLHTYSQRRPPTKAAEETSLNDAFDMADDWLAVADRRLPHRIEKAPRAPIAGVLVGRAAHHIVVDTGSALVGLRSDTIATPKRQQYDEEVSFQVRSPIDIHFDSRGNGHALQSRDRDDIDFALLKIAGVRHALARNEDALLMYDENYHAGYDLTGTVIAKRGELTAVYDTGAVLALLTDPDATIGDAIRRGPRANARTATRTR